MYNKIAKKEGITLIALVITIIIMLILVAVTISVAINGGLFNYAKIGAENTKAEIAREQGYATIKENLTTNELIAKFTSEKPVTIYGDVNLDGEITTADSTYIKRYVGGLQTLTEQQLANADVNIDGSVTEDDSEIIKAYVGSLVTELPYTGPILPEWYSD